MSEGFRRGQGDCDQACQEQAVGTRWQLRWTLEGQSGLACPVASVFGAGNQVWRKLPGPNAAG